MIRHKFNFFSVKINFCLFLLLLSLFTSTSYAISFAYDELGRLKAATDNAGNTAAYLYDALGNILQIQQIPNGTLAITEFTPDGGLIGSSVTLYGGGFSATPANNIVKFNGIAATVTSATATKLVVTVPTGATTGKIAVTVGGSTATSQENFTVVSSLGVPTISSFSPTCAVPGTLVTVTGTNFDPTPNATKLEIGASLAAIASISATQLQFTMPTLQGSGKVSVVTAKGKATNSAVLLVPPQQPTAIACTNIVSQQTLVVGGAAGALNINPAGKYGIIQFDGVLSDYLTLQVSGYAHSAGGSTAYTLYGPDNVSVASGNLSASNLSIHLPRLSKSGTHLIVFNPGSSATANFTAQLEKATDIVVDAANPTTGTITVANTSKRFAFFATTGQSLGLGITGLTLSPASSSPGYFRLYQPDGALLTLVSCYVSGDNCALNASTLQMTGNYVIQAELPSGTTGSFNLTLSSDVAGSLSVGVANTITLTRPGQNARYTFNGNAGQHLSLVLMNPTLSPTGRHFYVRVYAPDGQFLISQYLYAGYSVTSDDIPTLPLTGTYTVLVETDRGSATGSVQALLTEDVAATLTIDGAATAAQITQTGQRARLSFNATAGQNLGLGMTGLTLASGSFVSFDVYKADGGYVKGWYCFVSGDYCDINLAGLPVTGAYDVVVTPKNSTTGSFSLTLSTDLADTLNLDTAATATLTRPGQNARYTFNGSAGQHLSLALFNASTTPTGQSMVATVYKPDGTSFTSVSTGGGNTAASIYLPTLPVSGTYTVLVEPVRGGDIGSAQVLLSQDVTGTVVVDGPTVPIQLTQAGQSAYITFNGNAGQNLGLGIANLALTPAISGSGLDFRIFKPDGTSLQSGTCGISGSGCEADLVNLPMSGTYTIVVTPQRSEVGSFNLTLSTDLTGSLGVGATTTINLPRPGQNARYTFSGSMGQRLSMALLNPNLSPTNQTVIARVNGPDNSFVSSVYLYAGYTVSSEQLPALPLTGTYTVFTEIDRGGTTGSVQLLLAPEVAGTLVVDGPTLPVQLPQVGQQARISFNATAGQNLGLGMNGLSLATASYTSLKVYKPDGSHLRTEYCYTDERYCALNLANLPATGTYTLIVAPNNSSTGSFNLTLSTDLTDTLNLGATATVNLPRSGQNARYTLNGTAGQLLRLTLSNAVSTPLGRNFDATVYKPDGTTLGSTSITQGGTPASVDLTSLPVTGSYTVLIEPRSGTTTGSLNVLINTR